MIELVVLSTLVGIGYMLRQQQQKEQDLQQQTSNLNVGTLRHYPGAARLPRSEVDQKPRGKRHVDRVEKRYADRAYGNAFLVADGRGAVVSSELSGRVVSSELSGRVMSPDEFSHNNMVPFFKGSVKQLAEDPRRLETFTGNFAERPAKKELDAPMFDVEDTRMTPDAILGTQSSSQYAHDYAQEKVSIIQNNVLPFKQERVGPGILGQSLQGYQSLDINEVARPKTTEELRSVTNPKLSFEGRVVDGQKLKLRGELGKVR